MKTLTFNTHELFVLRTWLKDLDKLGQIEDEDRDFYNNLMSDTNLPLDLETAFEIYWSVTKDIAQGTDEEAEEAKNELQFKDICWSFVILCKDENKEPEYFLERMGGLMSPDAFTVVGHFLDQYREYKETAIRT